MTESLPTHAPEMEKFLDAYVLQLAERKAAADAWRKMKGSLDHETKNHDQDRNLQNTGAVQRHDQSPALLAEAYRQPDRLLADRRRILDRWEELGQQWMKERSNDPEAAERLRRFQAMIFSQDGIARIFSDQSSPIEKTLARQTLLALCERSSRSTRDACGRPLNQCFVSALMTQWFNLQAANPGQSKESLLQTPEGAMIFEAVWTLTQGAIAAKTYQVFQRLPKPLRRKHDFHAAGILADVYHRFRCAFLAYEKGFSAHFLDFALNNISYLRHSLLGKSNAPMELTPAIANNAAVQIRHDRGVDIIETQDAVDVAKQALKPDEIAIFDARFGIGDDPPMTLQEVAKKCNLWGRQQAERVLGQGLEKMRHRLGRGS